MTSTVSESSTTTTQQHIRNKKLTTITTTDLEETAVPDSTTTIEKEMTEFYSGQDVLLKQKDGRYYLGTVVEIDNINEQCLIKFGDNTERWSNYKDLNKLTTPEEQDLFCVVCKKLAPKNNNEITVCDKCGRGYHQKCHQPNIPINCQKDGATWICKRCTSSEPHRLRKSETKYLRRDSSFRNSANSSNDIQRTSNANVSSTKVLPYDLNSLNWDTYHRVNNEHTYCYCGNTGEWYNQMLQCARCRQWFHEKCLSCLQYPLYCGDRFYVFVCSICNHGKEFLRRLEMKWVDVVHLMLYNLTAYNSKKYYDLDKTIIPYINDNWHALQLPSKIYLVNKTERRENILSVLTNNRNRFKCGREIKKRTTIWGLRVRLPPPSPTITIQTTNGCITEDELKEMWQNNRRLQFLSLNTNINNLINKNNSHMKDIMMGTAYQQCNTPSETDSPCPSPEVQHEQDVVHQRLEDGLKFINHKNNNINKSDYVGAGCVKKSVPFTNISLQRRKRLLSVNSRERDRMLRRPNKRRNTNDDVFVGGDTDGSLTVTTTITTTVTAATTTKKRLSLDNKVSEALPLTPPTSVSAPPTPPASGSTSTMSDLSNDFSEHSNNTIINNQTSNGNRSRRTTNFSNVIVSNNNSNSGGVGIDSIELNTPCDTSGDETSSKSTLDLIIPRPKDFEGKNNPFLTLLRGNLDDNKSIKKRKSKDKSITLPLSLNAVIPGKPIMRPMKRQLSEKDIFIGPNGEVKRRRLRRNRQFNNNSYLIGQTASKTATVVPVKADYKEWSHQRQTSATTSTQPQQSTINNNNNNTQINNCVDYALNGRRLRQRPDKDKDKNQSTTTAAAVTATASTTTTTTKTSPVKQESDINMDDLKSSVNIYFGAANRIAAGERFTVKAKRIGPTGKLELLIEWEGPGNGMT